MSDRRATSGKMILDKVLLLAVAVVSVSVATPPPGYVATPQDNAKTGPKYDYSYDINDGDGGRQGHVESRDGVHAQGSYYVQLPHSDQQVRYSADDWGYHPLVTYGSQTKDSVTSAHLALGGEAVAALASLRKPDSSPTPKEGHPKSPPPGRLVITELHPSPNPLNASPPQDAVNSLRSGQAQRLTATIALDGNLPHVDVVPGRVRYLVKSLDNEVVADDASQKATIHGAQALPLTQSQSDAGDALFGAKLKVVSNSIAEAVTLRPIVVAELGDDNAVTAAPAAFTTASPIFDHSSTAIYTTARPILARPTTPSYSSSTPSFSGHVDVGEYGVPTATPATVVITPRPGFAVDGGDDADGHKVAMQFVKEKFKSSTIVEVQRAVPVEFEHAPSRDADDSNGIPIEYIQKVVEAAEGFGQKAELHSSGRERQPQRVYPVYSQTLQDGRDEQTEQQVEQQVLNAQLVQQFNQQQVEHQAFNDQQVHQQIYNDQEAQQQVFNDQQAQQQVYNDQQAQQQVYNDQQAQQQVYNDQQAQQQVYNDQQAQQQVYNDQQAQQQVYNDQQAQQQVYNDQQAQQQVYNDQQAHQQVFADQQAQQQALAEQQQQAYSDAIEQQVLKDQQAEHQVYSEPQLDQQVFKVAELQKTPQQVSVGHKDTVDSTQIIGLLPPINEQASITAPHYEQHVASEIAKLKQSHAFLVANHQVQEIAASRPSYVPVGDAQLVQANHERTLYRNQLLQAHSANQLLRQEHATLVAQQQHDPAPLVIQGTEELRLHDQFVAGNQHLLRGEQAQQQLAINAAALEATQIEGFEGGLNIAQQPLATGVRADADRLQQQAQVSAERAQAGVVTSLLKAENSAGTPLGAAYTAQLQANAIRRPTSAALHQQSVNTAHQNTLRFKTQAQTDKQADTENDYNQQLVEESKQDDIATVKPQPLGDVTHLRTLLRAEQAPIGSDVVGLTPPVQDAVQGAVHTIQVPVAIYQQPAIKQAVRLQFAQPTQLFPQFYQQAVVQQHRFPHEHVKVVNRPHPMEVTKLVAVDRPWSYPVPTGVPVNQYFRYNAAPTPLKLVRTHASFHGASVPRNPRFQTAAAHAYRAPPTRFSVHPKLADFQASQPEFFKPGRGVDHQELHRFHGRTKKLNIEYGFKPPLIPSQQIPVDDPQPEPEPIAD